MYRQLAETRADSVRLTTDERRSVMCAEFRGRYSPTAALAGILTALLIILGAKTAQGQPSVDEFPDLALTDFSHANIEGSR